MPMTSPAHSRREREADMREYVEDKIMQLHERIDATSGMLAEAPLQDMPEIVNRNLPAINLVLREIEILRQNLAEK